MADRFDDREYERDYGRNDRPGEYEDHRGRTPYGYDGAYDKPRRRFPAPEYPDRVGLGSYETRGYGRDDDYGATYASYRTTGRDYRYGPGDGRNYGYGRDGLTGERYGRQYDPYQTGYDARAHEERGWWERAKDEVAAWFGSEEAERRRRLDEFRAGPHRGRGPRGYKRSDERIKEDLNDRLTDHPYLDASDVEVIVSTGEVTLSGTVPSRYEKRLAEDLAETVSGVSHVQNNIRAQQNRTQEASPAVPDRAAARTAGS